MSFLFMNTKRPLTKLNIILVLAAAQLVCGPVWGEEQIETLAVFNGSNGTHPGNIIQGQHGDFYGTTYDGGAQNFGTIFEVPLNAQIKTLVTFSGANGANPDSHIVGRHLLRHDPRRRREQQGNGL
jgi:uncharacterized repeat protein (TIGR03803 family)